MDRVRSITIIDLLSVRGLLWPVLDFLDGAGVSGVAAVADLFPSSRNSCKNYCHQRDLICPEDCAGRFRYRRALVRSDKTLAALPDSVTEVVFSDYSNGPIRRPLDRLPRSLAALTLGFFHDWPPAPGELPPALTSLTFGFHFSRPLAAGALPSTLTKLTFGCKFDQELGVGVLPQGLTSLTFGYCYSRPLGPRVLPASLRSLEFGAMFTLPLTAGTLPLALTTLILGSNFDRPLDGVLPASLTALTLGRWFRQPLGAGVLPASLRTLTFGSWSYLTSPFLYLATPVYPSGCTVVVVPS